jgi:hypothetical protein
MIDISKFNEETAEDSKSANDASFGIAEFFCNKLVYILGVCGCQYLLFQGFVSCLRRAVYFSKTL